MKIKRIGDHNFDAPSMHRQGDLGYDLRACLQMDSLVIHAGYKAMIGVGFAFQFEPHMGAQVMIRSGLGFDRELIVISGGLIDSNYRGEVKVGVKNVSKQPITIQHGDRFAQMIFIWPGFPDLEISDEINQTYRGDKGYGSSGRE